MSLPAMNGQAFASQWAGQQLLIRFFHLLDAKRHEELVALFSQDAVWERPGASLSGHEEITASLRARPAQRVSHHVVSNFLVAREDGEVLHASCMLSTYAVDAPQPGVAPQLVGSFIGLFKVDAELGMGGDRPCIVRLQFAPSLVFAR
ncbi:MAG: hypothetical protein EON92_19095 [Burkholderiales bacterium]|nr:MAG: hypothetical protein EON92_19095 [Burkholderiales bacterium]